MGASPSSHGTAENLKLAERHKPEKWLNQKPKLGCLMAELCCSHFLPKALSIACVTVCVTFAWCSTRATRKLKDSWVSLLSVSSLPPSPSFPPFLPPFFSYVLLFLFKVWNASFPAQHPRGGCLPSGAGIQAGAQVLGSSICGRADWWSERGAGWACRGPGSHKEGPWSTESFRERVQKKKKHLLRQQADISQALLNEKAARKGDSDEKGCSVPCLRVSPCDELF